MDRRRNRRVETILRTTGQTLADVGYHDLSVEKVADALDLSKTALYYYFPSKDALIGAVIDNMADEVIARLQRIADASADSAASRFRALIQEQLMVLLCEYPEARRIFGEPGDWPEEHAAKIRAIRQRHYEVFERAIKVGKASGEFAPASVSLALHCMHGALLYAGVWYRGPRTREAAGPVIAEIVETVLAMFNPAASD